MLRSAWIFLAAILLPSLVLAWLAVRSARDQQVVLEHQQAIISQDVTDSLAKNVRNQLDTVRSEFVQITQDLLNQSAALPAVATDFDRELRAQWSPAEVGFAVDLRGRIYSPSRGGGPAAQTFREENERFLTNRENVEVYSSLNSQSLVVKDAGGFSNLTSNTGMMESAGKSFDLSPPAAVFSSSAPEPSTSGTPLPAVTSQTEENAAGARATLSLTGGLAERQATTPPTDADASTARGGQLPGASAPDRTPRTGTTMVESTLTPSSTITIPATPAATDSTALKRTRPEGRAVAVGGNTVAIEPSDIATRSVAPTAATTPPPAALPIEPGAPTTASVPLTDLPAPAATPPPIVSDYTDSSAPPNEAANQMRSKGPAAGASNEEKETALPAGVSVNGGVSVNAPATADENAAAVPLAPETAPAAAPPVPQANAAIDTLVSPQKREYQPALGQVARQVSPQNSFSSSAPMLSNTVPQESDFRRLIGADTSGALARFLDNKLQLMVWYHPTTTGSLVFGAQLDQGQLLQRLRAVLQAPEFAARGRSLTTPSYCVALLDDAGQPVALSIPGFSADWKHPFVATEIGETLPHWEAALYLTDPQQMSKSASTLRLIVGLIVALLVVAIVAGGSLIATDIRRQVRAAQQKTDFVSNVSHELKTPLTSIRVFADLLAEGRVTDPERQLTYLKIISAESARLTRLINNVLDFARQERGAPDGERRPCDLVETTRDVVETCLPHLEANGRELSCEIEAETLPIVGDRDALAQIVLNLVSNAEKYGGGEILVRVRRQDTAAGPLGCVDVLDRGPGIPPKQAESIFLPFHRLHDSLASGIPGSGIGLTLARRMARAHRGDVTCSPRAGGGSCFTLTVPLTARSS